ncbi:MAG: hypothetical protein H0U03_03100 [Actinobacteria bacterium]|nr:hypothetical protein [Actinomycetota bacterium]
MEPHVAVLYEHPLWFEPLFAELDRRGIQHTKLHPNELVWDPSERRPSPSLVVNRMSPSAWTRGHARATFHSLHYLSYLEDIGAPVLNGYGAFRVELSKAAQCSLFARLGLRYPATRVINDPSRALAAADGLRFPVLLKPNVGGSGAGIRSFATSDELAAAVQSGEIELGLDGTALVQEHLPARSGSIVRVEILGGEFLYAIRIQLVPGGFNLCPADYCELPGIADGISGRSLPIERFEPPAELIADARRLVAAAGMDLGGVEYLVSDRDGLPYFYDLNALSNFVADASNVVGFDPFVNLVDLIVERARSVPAELATAA